MSYQEHWPIDSHVQLHHNLQKILWLRLIWAKLSDAMPGIDHLFPCAVWKAHKEEGKERPGKTKPFSTQGLLLQRRCRCAAVAKNSVRLCPCFLLQCQSPCDSLQWQVTQEHGTVTSRPSHTPVLFQMSNVAAEMREKGFWESYFSAFQISISSCLRRKWCLCRF